MKQVPHGPSPRSTKKGLRGRLRSLVLLFCVTSLCLGLGSCAYFKQAKFGRLPQGDRLQVIEQSPNYRDGEFRNREHTPMFADEKGTFGALISNLFAEKVRPRPEGLIPALHTDLHSLDTGRDTVVWLGHSSYFMILDGKRVLIDPVLSDHAAPFSFANKAFAGTTGYRPEDIPQVDILLLSHDHWDHLDYETLTAIRDRVGLVVTGLGVGEHLERWGYSPEHIREADWGDRVEVAGLTIDILPARHFSGRLLTRNKTLWVAFALHSDQRRIFYSGDSGYGQHFAQIGELLGPFDLAILENGQYDRRWAYIHMAPEETAQAALDLDAGMVLPAHSGKFAMANHAWDEPLSRLVLASKDKPYLLLTPRIGEPVFPDTPSPFPAWWQGVP